MVDVQMDSKIVAKERRRTPVSPSGRSQFSPRAADVWDFDDTQRGHLEEGGVAAVNKFYLRPSKDRIITMFCVFLNTVSTVGLVFLNKVILSDPQLKKMQVSFAMWHFTCTAMVLWIASHRPFRLFQPVRLSVVKMMPLCSFFAGFLILNNLSLTSNSVGFYQLAKIMTTPCVVLFNFLLFSKSIALKAGLSLVSLCFGVALTNHNAAGSNPIGAVFAVAAFTTTAMYQIWISKKMKDFAVTSPQLLMNQAPISVFLLAFFVPAFDTIVDPRTIPPRTLVSLFFSGLVASLLNLSQFLIIGRTSPLTFNVTSHIKTIIILTLGWIVDGRVLSIQDLTGIIFAMGGAIVYSILS